MRVAYLIFVTIAGVLLLACLSAPVIRRLIARAFALGTDAEKAKADTRVAGILQLSADGLLTTDSLGTISQFSPGAEELFGYSTPEILGQNVGVLFPALTRDGNSEVLGHFEAGPSGSRVASSGAPLSGRRKDGESFPADVTIWQVGDGDDAMLTAAVGDASERTRLYLARVACEERFRSLFTHMLSGFAYCRMVYDERHEPVDFVFIEANGAFDRMTGLQDVVGRRMSELVPRIGMLKAELLAAFGRVAMTRLPESFEFEFGPPVLWLNIAAYSPEVGTFVALLDDITERKRLEEVRSLQVTALNSAADPIVITDRDGTIAWINRAFTDCTGYSVDDAIGRNSRSLIRSGVHDQRFYAEMWGTILAGRVWKGELTNRRKDGTLYPEMQTITPVRDAHGAITHFIAVKRDLTVEKKLQAELLQAQKMDSVGRLAGGVAHDFNNLLLVINGWTEMALGNLAADHPARSQLDEVLSAGQGAASLTKQLLSFARKQAVAASVFNINEVVIDMNRMLRRILGEHIVLSTSTDPALGAVKMDRGQLEQTLMNLAVNARDSMPRGGRLTVTTANETITRVQRPAVDEMAPGEYVTVSVSDTGTGMSEEVKLHLFEPFFTTKDEGKGTGLGLATSYAIVSRAGGRIDVCSETGSGTTLKIFIPRTRESIIPVAPARGKTPPSGIETILLVEDEPAVSRITAHMLEGRGYRVLRAASGDEAMRVMKGMHEPIHLLLTDVVLAGGMGGRDLADRIRALRSSVKVLYVSGYSDDAAVRHGVGGHEDALVHKPFTLQTLSDKVREVLDDT